MKGLKSILFAAAALIAGPAVITSCDDWTEPEAEDFYTPPTESYYTNLKDYFESPHKVMFGWFGSWTAAAKSNSLIGLPDSTDFVSLWLCWGNLNEAQQADLKAFQARGSKAVLCWLATNIGENITPGHSGVPTIEAAEEFWGFTNGDVPSMIEAARKYADAIADTCDKYNIDGFDMDIEATGTLIMGGTETRKVQNEFLRQLRKRFDESGRMLVIDIPGGVGWLHYYDYLDDDVVESVDYICWQTYELNHDGLDQFFNSVKSYKPDLFEKVLKKSIVTATFERAADKNLFPVQSTWNYSGGLEHAGQGAYHIEYDYPGTPDYPYVRKGIATQNPPINE
ncbi:glycoside hydrolase family 18 [Muribaculum intestinale]|uniref:glycoside hydrolase family 18 n=1 Tax=Muribaculum intestinale TaxID=1796646 RepID=UPI0025A969BE|nr:glycoside hydrolase family 18 [Muribaculum intestinale]